MQSCSKCGLLKESSEYFIRNKEKGLRHKQCKTCYNQSRQSTYREHYLKNKQAYLERAKIRRHALRNEFRKHMLKYLQGKECGLCGEKDIRTFEFDHTEPAKKLFSISQAVRLGYAWVDVEREIAKCRILCANCHKKETALQFGWYKMIQA